jgi:S-disulfanyl-L-cysteine oxidoreductase SoxD
MIPYRFAPWAAVGLIGLVGAGVVLFRQATEVPSMLKPQDPQVLALGKQVYMQHCASCHGAALQGQPDWQRRGADGLLLAPPHDESGHTWHHATQVLFDITKYGPQKVAGADYQSAMKPYADILSDGEIVAVLSYIKSTWSARVQRTHDQIDEDAYRKAKR